MSNPRPIIPLCITTASNGTVYLATFAYWQAAIGVDPDPDFFVVLKGNLALTISSSSSPTEYYMNWSAVAAIERMAVNIFPNKGNVYACAISPDNAAFVLHVVPDDYSSSQFAQVFSIQVPLGKIENDTGFEPIQMVLDERLNRTLWATFTNPYAVVSVQDLVGTPNTNGSNVNGSVVNVPQDHREWIHFTQTDGENEPQFSYAQTVNGSLPSQAKDGPRVQIFPGTDNVYSKMFAVHNRTFYAFCSRNINQQTIFSMPLQYNTTFEQPAQSSVQTWDLSMTAMCTLGSAMTVHNSVVYVYCNDSGMSVLISLDTLTNTTKKVLIQKDVSKVDWSMPSLFERTPATLRGLGQNKGLLIYHYSFEDPSVLFVIDADSGEMAPVRVDNVPYFSSQNQNRMLTTEPLTLSSVNSVLITIAAILFGIFLIWFQGANDRKRRRKWFSSDIPGSKVAEETNVVSFQAYQHAQSNETEQDRQFVLPPSSSSSPQSALQSLRVRGNRLGASSSLSEVDAVDLSDRPSPVLHDLGLESLQFSSHPRPNVVTTITDE